MTIQVQNLSKTIGTKRILEKICLTLNPGKINVLLGANGAGKSSLLRATLGIDKTQEGVVKIGDKPLSELSPSQRAVKIGYLSQNSRPEWNMRTQDLIELGRIPLQDLGQTNKEADRTAINDAMKKLGVEHLYDRHVHEISGGELSLCLLARVLAGNPEYIFADEPFNHLDIKHQLKLIMALKGFAQNGGGVLIIVHDISLAARLGDEFLLMRDGAIISSGSKQIALSDENLYLAYCARLGLREYENQSILINT